MKPVIMVSVCLAACAGVALSTETTSLRSTGNASTFGTAQVLYTYNDVTHVLTLSITNTSTITPGVAPPVMKNFFFNVPSGITGLSLLSQVANGGVNPGWSFNFDAVLNDGSNPNNASVFGEFNGQLATNGVQNALANNNATTFCASISNIAFGPMVFTFQASGASASSVTSTDFAEALSVNTSSASTTVSTAAHFISGGAGCNSEWVGTFTCPSAGTVQNLGTGCGVAPVPTLTHTPINQGEWMSLSITSSAPNASGILLTGFGPPVQLTIAEDCDVWLNFGFPQFPTFFTTDANGNFNVSGLVPISYFRCGIPFVSQAVIFAPGGPLGSVQLTNGVLGIVGSL